MSAIPIFIPYVNRPDLLQNAIASVSCSLTDPVVINNSGADIDVQCQVINPPVPLSFTQSQNLMLKIAKDRSIPFYFWMHCDAEAELDTIEKLYALAAHECSQGKWGVIFTLYDIVSVCNTEAFDSIGGYDTNFFDYCSDQDAYRRLKLKGYPLLESNLPVKHLGSQTINSDPARSRIVGIQVPYRNALYRAKWGGDVGHETFDIPWGGK
jgi:hypothetical protein